MGHYFENNPPKTSQAYTITYRFADRTFTLQASSGVFSKQHLDPGSRLLIHVLLQETLSGTCLDLGCGYGPVGLTLASLNPQLKWTLADINERAVIDAKHNAQRLGLTDLQIVTSDGFQELTQLFDVIAFNPPIRAGKKTIYRLYQEAKQHLTPNGACYIVIRKDKGAASHETYLLTLFSKVTRRDRDKGYLVLCAQP
jgi:16S rRNA (guanine1207-N2)-methyltransferase